MASIEVKRVAVVGAGMAGATCARALAQAGHGVQVFDKARRPGGRLATRRLAWVDGEGELQTTLLDHGAPGLSARGETFGAYLGAGLQAGALAQWRPALAPGSLPLDDAAPIHVPVPDSPTLCRDLLAGLATTWSCAIDGLHRSVPGWHVEAAGQRQGGSFDAVVLALPPAQAAPLLAAHRPDWARHASLAPMQPCWTLMGVATERSPSTWDLARPAAGPGPRLTGSARWRLPSRSSMAA
ncbi:MAG: FAD-dependent oxidoreductase, partial [Rubrivivax sp.]